MGEIIKEALEYGFLGLAVLVLVSALRVIYQHARDDRRLFDEAIKAKDKALLTSTERLSQEQELRVADAQRFTGVALKLQAEVISSVASIERWTEENAKLCGLVEKLLETVGQLRDELRDERRRSRPPRH